MARRQMGLSTEAGGELAGSQDHILRTLEERLECDVFLRGNMITLDGEADAVQAGATVVRELSSMVERGADNRPAPVAGGRGGVAPAGTGKTFLATAMPPPAPARREDTRTSPPPPAVEAGERLGFLPGDLMAKV